MLVSVEDYLAQELTSAVKHEYLGGYVYAKAGARNSHSIISTNIITFIHSRLKGKGCRPYGSDTKIRIRLPSHTRFYYPDVSIVCNPNPQSDSFQDQPIVIVEVISPESRRVDEGEKKDYYFTIPTLGLYVLVEQEMPLAVCYRRTGNGFEREVFEGWKTLIPIPDLKITLPLSEIFEGVEFVPE